MFSSSFNDDAIRFAYGTLVLSVNRVLNWSLSLAEFADDSAAGNRHFDLIGYQLIAITSAIWTLLLLHS